MRKHYCYILCLGAILGGLALGGCRKESAKADSIDLVPEDKLGTRIGSIVKVAAPEPVPVQGYGLVSGLAGTGSANCPPAVRDYLKRYIMTQLPAGRVNVDEFINSKDTAVVRLDAMMPAAASQGDRFDVQVSLLAGSEASSLHGGWLLKAELKPVGRLGTAGATSSTVEGAVFINKIGVTEPALREGYILGGGRVAADYQGVIVLRKADFLLASQIRNRLNDRYGSGTAEALSQTTVTLRIPPEYRLGKLRFLRMVEATYLDQTPELVAARSNAYVHRLAVSDHKESSEIALEALGRDCLGKVETLLNASDEEVRFRAARCVLNLNADRGFAALRQIALDPKSPWRLDALKAIAVSAKRNDAASVARGLLRDADPAVMLAAYEHLRKMEDLAVRQELIGRSFYLEHVAQTDRKAIYVTRTGAPRIVLFGAPLTCRNNIFVESPDRTIIVNSQAGQEFVSLTRKYPRQSGPIGSLRTDFDLANIIRVLGTEPVKTKDGSTTGLGVSYADTIAILEQLAVKDMIAAQFWAGPLPEIGLIIKK